MINLDESTEIPNREDMPATEDLQAGVIRAIFNSREKAEALLKQWNTPQVPSLRVLTPPKAKSL